MKTTTWSWRVILLGIIAAIAVMVLSLCASPRFAFVPASRFSTNHVKAAVITPPPATIRPRPYPITNWHVYAGFTSVCSSNSLCPWGAHFQISGTTNRVPFTNDLRLPWQAALSMVTGTNQHLTFVLSNQPFVTSMVACWQVNADGSETNAGTITVGPPPRIEVLTFSTTNAFMFTCSNLALRNWTSNHVSSITVSNPPQWGPRMFYAVPEPAKWTITTNWIQF